MKHAQLKLVPAIDYAAADRHHAQAFRELEPRIRDMAYMAEIAYEKTLGPIDDTGLAEWATARLCDMAAELKAEYYCRWQD